MNSIVLWFLLACGGAAEPAAPAVELSGAFAEMELPVGSGEYEVEGQELTVKYLDEERGKGEILGEYRSALEADGWKALGEMAIPHGVTEELMKGQQTITLIVTSRGKRVDVFIGVE